MADRLRPAGSVGDLLKDMALRPGSAFPDLPDVYAREAERRGRRRLALRIGTGFVALCLAGGLSLTVLSPEQPLIAAWEKSSGETGRGEGSDPLVSYLDELWDASSIREGGLR